MYQKTVLHNGLRILTSNIPHVRSVSVSVFVGSGSRYESLDKAGISHFVEHMLFKGTSRRPTSNAIAEAVEGVGGVLNGGTDKELTVYWVKVMNSHLNLAMDVLADLVRFPIFDPAEVDRERQIIIEEINMCTDFPQQRVNMLIDEIIWPDQALGRDVAGNKDSVSAFNREMLLDYWTNQYGPSNTVISVAGNIQHDEVVNLTDQLFGDWVDGSPSPWFTADDFQQEPRLRVEHRDIEQDHICVALRGVSNQHPDRFAFDVINVILGEGMSCRLFCELREKKGLAYDIHSYVSHYFDTGSLTVYAGVGPGNIESTIEAILNEFSQLKNAKVSETELTKAKEMVKGRLVLRMEDSRSVSGWIASQELLMDKIRSIDEVISIVESITAEDLQRVASTLFNPNGLSCAIVGPNINESHLKSLLVL